MISLSIYIFQDTLYISTSSWHFSSSSSDTLHCLLFSMWRSSVTPLCVLCCFSLHVSLIGFICDHISIILLRLLFPCYLLHWWIPSQLFYVLVSILLHSYLPLSVRRFSLFFYLYSLVSVVTIYFPLLFFFDFLYCGWIILFYFCHISFLSSLCYRYLFANEFKVIFIYILSHATTCSFFLFPSML